LENASSRISSTGVETGTAFNDQFKLLFVHSNIIIQGYFNFCVNKILYGILEKSIH